jgi:hypothetical protein
MKKLFAIAVLSFCLLLAADSRAQSVGIGTTTPSPSAQLDITSTTKGILIPRMTQAERDLLAPVQGLLVYNTSSNSFQYHTGSSWTNLTSSGIVSGTPNKIPKFVGLWGLSPGLMTDNAAGIAINNTNANPDASALLDMTSTAKGVLIPRMTSVERTSIGSPAKGLMVFDNTTSTFWFHNGTSWAEINSSSGAGDWSVLGSNIYNSNAGNVGIGASTPPAKLTVNGDALILTGLGIGLTVPDFSFYKLDVNGNARVRQELIVNSNSWVDGNFDVDGTSNFFGTITASNNLNIAGDINAGNNVSVDNNHT